MNKNLWNRLLKGMRNDELSSLSFLIQREQTRRAAKRIREGRFSELTEEEVSLAKTNKYEAIQKYKDRTKCLYVMAKMVIEVVANSRSDQKSLYS